MKLVDIVPADIPWPLALIILVGLALLAAVYAYAVRLSAKEKQGLLRCWWMFLVVIVATIGAGATYSLLSSPAPAPKAEGKLRVVVAACSDSTIDSDVAFAVASIVQRLVQTLHIDHKVEVWLAPPVVLSEDVEGAMRLRNADVLLWLHASATDGQQRALFPALYVCPPGGSVRQIGLRERTWGPTTGYQFTSVVLQVALETLDLLDPVLPDGSSLMLSSRGPADYGKIVLGLGEGGPGGLKLSAYVWSMGAETASRADTEVTDEVVVESQPVTLDLVGEDGRPVGSVLCRAQLTYTRQEPSVDCVTYAVWMHNAGDDTLPDAKVSLGCPGDMRRAKGMLTVNGVPVPDTGGIAQVEAETGDVMFSIGDLRPGERALATGTYAMVSESLTTE